MPAMSSDAASKETMLALVRHGESLANHERRFGGHGPTPLTERGHTQARVTGRHLADRLAPTAIVSSDLARAQQTADHIAAATGLDVETTPGLRERGLGRLDGLLFEEVRERYPDDWAQLLSRDPDWASPGGESNRAVFERVARAIDDIVARHRGGRVVVVSHGVAIYLAFAHVCGIDPLAIDSRVYINVDNCSITRAARRHEGVWRLDALNDAHHLAADGATSAPTTA